ncbi:outer membrane beta-barrel protein [Aquincola tertiaricarbonis]|uniref:Outer membrane beta-barrel protein n=1 Tax=Aquincola tertiaricarbonis TaxID=391953 RepID=A0ABY4SGK0_AQUTE|nr:OmpW family outer membrane protein [Aquincola tertiaricarbonis]URI10445.1 outer membrane beta-barrel protein [Aquincola tertiaricarbonis]
MNKRCQALALAAAALTIAALPAAHAQDSGDWIVRARALHLDSADKDNTGLDLSLKNKTFPEVDITYFFTPNIAAELVLTYPQKHDLRAGGDKIGSLKHLPPTLSLQYHFTGMSFRPYLGAGINYTRFSSVDLPAGVDIDRSSWGLALGAGVDVPVGNGWLVNVDVKKVQIRTDVSAAGSNLGSFKVDPLLVSVGFGKRF